MSAVIAKVGEETKATENEGVKKPSFKVSPLYEGDTTVDLTDPFYSESNINYLLRIVADIESGKAKLEEHELIEV